ncbi:MAG: hypothetical protein ACRCYY_14225 [Trueperaceae bacterium]
MKRSLQEVIELVVFGLIALLIGTGLLWLVGWLLGIVSVVFIAIAGWIWQLLRFIIPVALVAGVVFFLYRVITKRNKPVSVTSPIVTPVTTTSTTPIPSNDVTTEEKEVIPPSSPESSPSDPNDSKDAN